MSAGGVIKGKLVPSIPIGPQWVAAGGKFVLGADTLGRDVAVRLLYGGRNSLLVGIGSSAICVFFAVVLALLAGYFGGWIDFVITRFFDLFYAFPVVLLGIALGSALAINGFHHFGINIESGSLWIPTARHLVRPHPVRRASAARPGAVAAREGVRRGLDLAGRDAAAGHVLASCCRTSRARCSSSSR